jgi:hypothetical protein
MSNIGKVGFNHKRPHLFTGRPPIGNRRGMKISGLARARDWVCVKILLPDARNRNSRTMARSSWTTERLCEKGSALPIGFLLAESDLELTWPPATGRSLTARMEGKGCGTTESRAPHLAASLDLGQTQHRRRPIACVFGPHARWRVRAPERKHFLLQNV